MQESTALRKARIIGLIPRVHELDSWTLGKRARSEARTARVATERNTAVMIDDHWYYWIELNF